MNTLTAIRSFARPGYCPVHLRIENRKFYIVTMQNIETDPRCDYVGLGEGEYSELLPGSEARSRREAHLNHCNHIEEYKGPVYALTMYEFNRPLRIKYVGSSSDIETERVKNLTRHTEWVRKVKEERDRCPRWATECETALAEWENRPEGWRIEVERARP